jgi:hypothetical protein
MVARLLAPDRVHPEDAGIAHLEVSRDCMVVFAAATLPEIQHLI